MPRSATGAEGSAELKLDKSWELWADDTVLEKKEGEAAIVLVRSADRPELEADITGEEELIIVLTPRGTGEFELTNTEDSWVANAFEVVPEVLWNEFEPE